MEFIYSVRGYIFFEKEEEEGSWRKFNFVVFFRFSFVGMEICFM